MCVCVFYLCLKLQVFDSFVCLGAPYSQWQRDYRISHVTCRPLVAAAARHVCVGRAHVHCAPPSRPGSGPPDQLPDCSLRTGQHATWISDLFLCVRCRTIDILLVESAAFKRGLRLEQLRLCTRQRSSCQLKFTRTRLKNLRRLRNGFVELRDRSC